MSVDQTTRAREGDLRTGVYDDLSGLWVRECGESKENREWKQTGIYHSAKHESEANMRAMVLIAMVVMGCGGSAQRWSDSQENDFLKACSNAGGSRSNCACLLSEMEDRYSDDEIRIAMKDDEDGVRRAILESAAECI